MHTKSTSEAPTLPGMTFPSLSRVFLSSIPPEILEEPAIALLMTPHANSGPFVAKRNRRRDAGPYGIEIRADRIGLGRLGWLPDEITAYVGPLVAEKQNSLVVTNHRLFGPEAPYPSRLMVGLCLAPPRQDVRLIGSDISARYPANIKELIVDRTKRAGRLAIARLPYGPAGNDSLVVIDQSNEDIVGFVPRKESLTLAPWFEQHERNDVLVDANWHIRGDGTIEVLLVPIRRAPNVAVAPATTPPLAALDAAAPTDAQRADLALELVAQHLINDPHFLAGPLTRMQQVQDEPWFDWGLRREHWESLKLTRPPRPEAWDHDVRKIAAFFEVPIRRIEHLLAEVLQHRD